VGSVIEIEDPGHAVKVHEDVLVVVDEVKDLTYLGQDIVDTVLTVKVPVQAEWP